MKDVLGLIVYILVFVWLWWLVDGYELHEFVHKSRVIHIDVCVCPPRIPFCDKLFLQAVDAVSVVGLYYTFVVTFGYSHHAVRMDGVNTLCLSESLVYPQLGYTNFVVDKRSNAVVEFDTVIHSVNIHANQVYNVMLHELLHILLVDHGPYRDSISGYKVVIGDWNDRRLNVSLDDYSGLMAVSKRESDDERQKSLLEDIERMEKYKYQSNMLPTTSVRREYSTEHVDIFVTYV